MIIGTPKEIADLENRVAMTPASVKQLIKLGHECLIEKGAGERSQFSDKEYEDAGAKITQTAVDLYAQADVIAKVLPVTIDEVKLVKEEQSIISFFYPAQNEELLSALNEKKATVMAMDMVPRISRAQKMDALSSMANIAGYRAVIEASNNFGRFFTGQITAAGKVPPAKVLVIGAGVAGLAAIGAAQSLGAVVRAFDVRPEVAEQIESMGAEFLFLDFEEDGSGDGGYAAPSSPEFREKQLALFRDQAADVDIVVTTALIPGRDAPKLWLEDMVHSMKAGSVIVDLAAERGGNCDLTQKNEKIVTENGVTIIGYTDFPSKMASQASTLYATNIRHLVDDLTPDNDGLIDHNMDDDIIRGVTASREGAITFPPPAPKVQAIAKPQAKEKPKELTAEEKKAAELAAFKEDTKKQFAILGAGALLLWLVGSFAPASFMQHFIVFVLSCFVGYHIIWNVAHSLHTPLMAVTNAISGIVIIGALLQVGSSSWVVIFLAFISILIATINIVGGFLVTRRMLAMFQKS